jgi:hypothetical protein
LDRSDLFVEVVPPVRWREPTEVRSFPRRFDRETGVGSFVLMERTDLGFLFEGCLSTPETVGVVLPSFGWSSQIILLFEEELFREIL